MGHKTTARICAGRGTHHCLLLCRRWNWLSEKVGGQPMREIFTEREERPMALFHFTVDQMKRSEDSLLSLLPLTVPGEDV